ncbi:MAG: GGDEF domain-containing protein [Thiohalocapsa sp.]|nr:GGDEF domain-containing protein [Thiohalocapsa sp.]
MDLDGRTLLVAASLTSILLAMLVLHVRRWLGKSIHGLGWWAAAVILLTGSTLLLADLDRFKAINDTHGHGVGDRALKAFADVASAQIRDGDLFARHGGEELVVLLPGTGHQEARAIAERIRAATEAAIIDGPEGKPIRLSVSIGAASALPGSRAAVHLDPLLRDADRAMYRAKESGRNRVVGPS